MALPTKRHKLARTRPPRMEDASMGLAHDLALLDRNQPGWDYEIRIQGALRRLREDASVANRRDVELLFGKVMADDAYKRVIKEWLDSTKTVARTASSVRHHLSHAKVSRAKSRQALEELAKAALAAPKNPRLQPKKFRAGLRTISDELGEESSGKLRYVRNPFPLIDYAVKHVLFATVVRRIERVTALMLTVRNTEHSIESTGLPEKSETLPVTFQNTKLSSVRRAVEVFNARIRKRK